MSFYQNQRMGNWRAAGQRPFQNRRQQHNEPGKFNNFATSSSTPASGLSRMESLLETMAKSMETLTGRLNTLEKGLPSQSLAWKTNPIPPLISSLDTSCSFPPLPHTTSHFSGRTPLSTIPGPSHAHTEPARFRSSAPTAPTPHSDNPDFHQICKSLNRMVQLRRHMVNWTTLPSAIHRNIQHVASNIRPVHPSDELIEDISRIFSKAGSDVQQRVQAHFTERLALNLSILKNSNPSDKERAVEVVTRQLKNRLGSKVSEPNLRLLVESEAKVIGISKDRSKVVGMTECRSEDRSEVIGMTEGRSEDRSEVIEMTEDRRKVDEGDEQEGFRKPKKPSKIPCTMKTPPTLASHNSFTVLSPGDEDCTDVEEDSPSPLRKPPHSPPKVPLPASILKSNTVVPFSLPKPSTSGIPRIIEPKGPKPIPRDLGSSSKTAPSNAPHQPISKDTHLVSSLPRFNDHHGSNKKSWHVKLRPDTRHLIISDSNFKYLRDTDIPPGFQLECFRGATFVNILDVVKGLPMDGTILRIFFSLGINHKDQDFHSTVSPAIDLFIKASEYVADELYGCVGISINPGLSAHCKNNLKLINAKLKSGEHTTFVEPLADHEIITEPDTIHYTRDTQLRILRNIIQTQPKN